MRRALLLVAAVLGVVGALGGLAPRAAADVAAGAAGADVPDGRRTVVIAVPGLTWEDVNDEDVPHLRALLDESAVANASLRVERLATKAGEGYATLGAGTRAVAEARFAGLAYDRDEPFGTGTAGDELGRQLGHPVDGDVVHLGWHELQGDNRSSEFDADLGTLGDALRAAGVSRGVVGNADGDDPLVAEYQHREAALALADADGVVPCGEVGPTLLRDDPEAPFGRRLDHDAVLAAFRRCSTPGSVVLVEASDLRRADAYTPRIPSRRDAEVRGAALAATDQLVADILVTLDPARDAVVVIAPAVASGPRLAVLGVRAAEYRPGLLVSGSTRQDGYVLLTDVTDTIAQLAGAPIDEGALEGRRVEVGSTGGSAADRRERLEDADAAARFRDEMITPVAGAYIAAVGILALAALWVLNRRRRSPGLEVASLSLLAVTPLTYLARLLPFHEWGPGPYVLYLVAGVTVLGFLYARIGRRWSWLHPLAIAYGVMLAVIAVSVVLLGSELQMSTVFGDSPIVAGRFNGINNVTFAQLFIAVTLLAAVAVDRLPSRRARIAVVVILAGGVIVDAAPMWGADVGGALAGLPALAIVGARLGGWKIRWRTVLVWCAVTVVAVVALGLLDLTRESADRSHLGRLFERIGSEGASGLWTVVERKLGANLRSLSGSVWRFILVPVIAGLVVTAWRAPGRLREVARGFPALPLVLPGVVVGLVLGYALNDSGIAVPGMMLAVSVPAVVYLVSRVEPSAEPEAPGSAPAARA